MTPDVPAICARLEPTERDRLIYGQATRFADCAADLFEIDLICLGTTLSGAPKHPMARGRSRIPRDQQPIIWRKAK